ncbi:ubiquinol-cytochrome c reductase iron-sulfur subunit [Massilia soli]|uniref:Ubiquinol-cytochrome c reductase iron-sulfur subunit n=1 Tax=Massilia soli TaxID=2792854 RepID=A0ABS7SSN5_9BURK|nr:ubiquinol-cytochrome c reductase iron-sulfur subunit [Massilia soli]MBZ2208949.1 ubiquinol-cytochrome c reductase iron-sulfur subunit [Massilia soli]
MATTLIYKALSYKASRRQFLTASTIAFGGAGLAAMTMPFIASMLPSERARAAGAPVEADTTKIAPGELVTVEWRGRPVWILHRTPQQIASLGGHDDQLVDPASRKPQQPPYAANPSRSLKPEFLVLTAICTHLGCIPSYRPEPGAADIGADWPGGFYCPCHGSRFDLAGRVFENVPAPSNMEVPPHNFMAGGKLLIGVDPA